MKSMTHPGQRRRYKNPPIEEALVEFRFVPAQEWDLTIPGKLHERVKGAYPGKPRQQKLLQAAFQAVQGHPPGFAVHEGVGRVQLVDADARRLLSLGPDVLSVNVLRPYDGWELFKPRIAAALEAYAAVAEAKHVGRIGVRYINKVVIPQQSVDVGQYFLCGPAVPEQLPTRIGGFLCRSEHTFDDGAKLLLTFASIDAERDSSSFLLDLDVTWEGDAISVEEALARADALHERESTAFEAVITDKTRGVFDAG